jgi:hypothetical protein
MLIQSQLRFTDFSELFGVIQKFSDRETEAEKFQLLFSSLNLSDEKLSLDEKGRVIYTFSNGEETPIVLYINTQVFPKNYFSISDIREENLNRYHFYNCDNLQNAYKSGFLPVGSARKENGFPYKFEGQFGEKLYEREDQPLLPCRRCLDIFNHQEKSRMTPEQFHQSYLFTE